MLYPKHLNILQIRQNFKKIKNTQINLNLKKEFKKNFLFLIDEKLKPISFQYYIKMY